MIEIRIRTRCASSYDNYLSPSMIGGLVVLRRMKYLAFKRVLLPSILANRRIGKKKKGERVSYLSRERRYIILTTFETKS